MSQQIINVGTANNDGTGDPLRVAMTKIQNNFSEIYGSFVTPGSIFVGSNSVSITANSTGFSNTNDTILITSANSNFLVDDRVYYAVPTGNTPIAPLTGNTYYYVSFSNTTTVKLSLTYGGANVDISDARVTNPGETHSVTYADRTIVISNTGVSISSNSTVNSTSNSTVIRVANSTYSANLTSGGLNVGANVSINATAVRVGNSTIFSNIASSSRFTGAVTVANTLTVNGQTTIANTIFISGGIEVNRAGTGDRNAVVDFRSDDTYTDYSFRMIAASGANSLRQITARGTSGIEIRTEDAAPIYFSANTIEAVRITASGNVGIGNTAPNAKLHVTGTANISGAVVLSNTLAVTGIATFSGNVGVGCTSPTVIMTVSANAGAASAVFAGGNTFLRLTSNGSFSEPAMEFGEQALSPTAKIASKNEGNGGGSLFFITRDTSATNSTLSTRLVIDSNGNTGIGNTAPNAKLQVTGAANISGAVVVSNALTVTGTATITNTVFSAGGIIELNNNGTGDRNAVIDFHSDDTYTDYSFRMFAQAGNNSLRQITARGTSGIQIQTEDAAPIYFSANTIEAVRITAGANVGIGNTAPNAKLQVTGTANISGAVTLSTSLAVSTNTLTLGSSNVGAANFANGYARLPNGLLMQFGQLLVNTTTAAQTFSVVTGVAFTNVFSMTATSNTLASAVALTALSATAFTIVSNTAANVAVYWTAIGK